MFDCPPPKRSSLKGCNARCSLRSNTSATQLTSTSRTPSDKKRCASERLHSKRTSQYDHQQLKPVLQDNNLEPIRSVSQCMLSASNENKENPCSEWVSLCRSGCQQQQTQQTMVPKADTQKCSIRQLSISNDSEECMARFARVECTEDSSVGSPSTNSSIGEVSLPSIEKSPQSSQEVTIIVIPSDQLNSPAANRGSKTYQSIIDWAVDYAWQNSRPGSSPPKANVVRLVVQDDHHSGTAPTQRGSLATTEGDAVTSMQSCYSTDGDHGVDDDLVIQLVHEDEPLPDGLPRYVFVSDEDSVPLGEPLEQRFPSKRETHSKSISLSLHETLKALRLDENDSECFRETLVDL